MVRFLLFLLGTLTTRGPERGRAAWYPAGNGATIEAAGDGSWPDQGGSPAGGPSPAPGDTGQGWAGGRASSSGRNRRPAWRRVTWIAALAVTGLIFRRAIASVTMLALSAALHLAGLDVRLPSVRFGWPWQAAGSGGTANTDLGPWVLQKIEGISRPALGQANFTFVFTHRVSKNIGPWPCWYASTFYAVGHASATVDLNPGRSWWTPADDHYRLRVLSRPAAGKPGRVSVAMTLPQPQLPRSVHDVSIDNLPSRPVSVQHSWTYPGFGCGVLIRPQFSPAVLYSDAQRIAFQRATHAPQITGALVRTAEAQAARIIRNNFIQPTLNALGYSLDQFALRWAGPARQRVASRRSAP